MQAISHISIEFHRRIFHLVHLVKMVFFRNSTQKYHNWTKNDIFLDCIRFISIENLLHCLYTTLYPPIFIHVEGMNNAF